jgi:hypothetical protein
MSGDRNLLFGITLLRQELAMDLPLETTWHQLACICVQKGKVSCYED